MTDTIQLRKTLHQFPELSGYEAETAQRISAFLKRYMPDELITNVGGSGILAIYSPNSDYRRTIVFRCELDALPIQEVNEFDHKSQRENVSHKCGHDGHMAIMCELAKRLSNQRPLGTRVVLLFQPAEENGAGAVAIYGDARFKSLEPDKVFALHNLPGYPLHEIVIKDHTFTCAVNSIIIKLHGRTSHAGEPEKGDNPALAIAGIIQQYNSLIQPDSRKEKFTILTPIYINMGTENYGISAGYGEVHYTFRRAANDEMKELEAQLEQIARSVAAKYNLGPEISWTQRFSANENSPGAADIVRSAARACGYQLTEREAPFQWGEDFGLFTEHYEGAMFGLGSGIETSALHNPDYDFPDEIISTGAGIFHKIVELIDAQ